MFSLIIRQQSNVLYSYDNILFKTYLDIVNNGGLEKLVVSGKFKHEELTEAWEAIIKKNSEHTGSYHYGEYFQLQQAYKLLIAEYHIVKAMLSKLAIVCDEETVKELNDRGYKIYTDNERYSDSLLSANSKADNLVTKIRMKQKEILTMEKESEERRKDKKGFEDSMANLCVNLGFTVENDITLARYNEYQKVIKRKIENSRPKEV